MSYKLAAVVVALVLVLGCSKRRDCQTVIDNINKSVEKLQKAETTSSKDPAVIAQAFAAYAELAEAEAAEIDKIRIDNQELNGYLTEYQAMAKEVAAGATKFSRIMNEVNQLSQDLERANAALKTSEKAVIAACAGGSDDCGKVDQARRKAPQGTHDDEQMAAKLNEFIKELEGLELNDDKVKTALGAYIKVVKTQADLLEKRAKAMKEGDAANKQLDEAAAKEDPLVTKINSFCEAT